jgi:hypothetical protein
MFIMSSISAIESICRLMYAHLPFILMYAVYPVIQLSSYPVIQYVLVASWVHACWCCTVDSMHLLWSVASGGW